MSKPLFEHRISTGTSFRVEQDGNCLTWEFHHEPLRATWNNDADQVAYYKLLHAAATLRRWAAELTHKAHELSTPELEVDV